MCGIAGLWQYERRVGAADLSAHAKRMADTLTHRGPDASGVWADPDGRCALSHRRLSIIDTSSAGAQPFCSRDKRWWVTFNGEIYNFMDVRDALEKKGHVFASRSDTEVLVEAIAEWGVSAVERFDGMFAFAAFDTRSGDIILARDPFGEKPFYITSLPDNVVAFASELRALEQLPGFDARISMDSLAEYLCFQYVGAPRTIYENVHKLQPGHVTVYSPGKAPVARRYFAFDPGRDETRRSFADAADELEAILVRSIERRLVSDVPIGAFLSGGVDSSLVCALVTQKLRIPLNTYSMGFAGAPESEHLVARAFAEHLGTRHHESIVSPDVGRFLDIAGSVLDEPNADTSCFPTYLLSQFAREQVTVAVSGDGGDEMFGGYGRYSSTLLEQELQGIGELPFWKPGGAYYGPRILISSEADVAALLGHIPSGCERHLQDLRADLNQNGGGLLSAMRRSDVDNYMPGAVLAKVDRMSMQHSLEVRTPFLNVELARFAEKLPARFCCGHGVSKRILREIACRYLPKSLVNLPKQGFGLPMADWTRDSLLPRAQAMLRGDSPLHELFGTGLDQAIARHATPDGFNAYQLWSIVVLEAWLKERNVTLPEIRRKDQTTRQAVNDRSAFWATRVAENVFVVALGGQQEAPPLRYDEFSERMHADLAKLTSFASKPPEGVPAVRIHLEAEAPSQAIEDRFSGATLFFVDKDIALRIGAAECARLRGLRVHRILMPHRFESNGCEDLTFRYFSVERRITNLFHLWRRRVGSFALQGKLPRLFAGRSLYRQDNHMYFAEGLSRVEGPADSELTRHYAVFEGTTQCLPLSVDFADVDRLGDGRYWAYNGMLAVSPRKASRGKHKLFWGVSANAETARYLEIVPTPPESEPPRRESVNELTDVARHRRHASFDAMLEHIVEDAASLERLRPLERGDRIVVFTHGLPPGGAERQWVYLASALTRMGFRVTFVVLNALQGHNAHYLPYLRTNGIEVLQCCDLAWGMTADRLQKDYGLDFEDIISRMTLAQIVNAFELTKPRAVFAQLDYPNIVAAVAGLICKVERIVVSFRNYNPSNFDYVYLPWYQSAYRILSTSSRIAMTGNFLGANDDYADWIGIPRSRIATIHNALDHETFPAAAGDAVQRLRRTLDLSDETPVILGVFRLSAEKRPLVFVEIARALAEKYQDLHILLAGVGPLLDDVREALAGSPAASRFHVVGQRDDVNVLMATASFLLHTAAKEGMPNVIMEAVVSGVPVVATDAGAISSLVADGENGFVRDLDDIDGLREACERLLEDGTLVTRMRQAALRRAEQGFSPETMAKRYLEAAGYSEAAPRQLAPAPDA